MIVEHTIEIERPIDEVFEVVTCRRHCVVWVGPMSNLQMDNNEPAHIGSTFSGEIDLFDQTIYINGVMTELDPPHHWAFKSISPSGLTRRYTFAPTEHGTTFRIAVEVEGGPIMELFKHPSLLKAGIESPLQKGMELLKMLMESDVDLWTFTPPLPR